MATCKWWKDQPDGYHGYCEHPDARPGDVCILNTADACVHRELPGVPMLWSRKH